MPAPSRLVKLRARTGRLALMASVAVAVSIGLAACGGDSGSGTSPNASQQANGPRGFLQDPKVQACLKKQGVTLGSGDRRPGGQGPNGQPPTGTNGQPPARPNGGQRNSPRAQKLRQALQKCGVQGPNGPPNGAPPQTGTTTGTTAS
jgi:hypothetical protein